MQNGLDLGGAYGDTLRRIKAQGGEKERDGMAVLMWITHSRRSLQVDELRHALAVRIGSNDLESDNIPAISTMLACCQGLATIEKDTSTVRLIHYTPPRVSLHTSRPLWRSSLYDGGNLFDISQLPAHQGSFKWPAP